MENYDQIFKSLNRDEEGNFICKYCSTSMRIDDIERHGQGIYGIDNKTVYYHCPGCASMIIIEYRQGRIIDLRFVKSELLEDNGTYKVYHVKP